MRKDTIIRSGLETLYFTGAHKALRPLLGGIGAILTLHNVRPARPDAFQPNRLLEVTPEFLDRTIGHVMGAGLEPVSLDEAYRRLLEGWAGKRFVCFTFDDGYRDNKTFAYPILKKHGVPFAVYVPTSFPEGRGDLWWLTLERLVAQNEELEIPVEGDVRRLRCESLAEKREAFATLYWMLRAGGDEDEMRGAINALAARYGVSTADGCSGLCMGWNELRELAADPLVTIGAHTINHVMLRKAPADAVRREMEGSATAIERELGARPAHFSFPVGDPTSAGPREFALAKEAGFKTAVTTRPGVLFPEHRDHLTALPRISLNGEYQRTRYVDVLLSGAATAVWNRFRRVDAA